MWPFKTKQTVTNDPPPQVRDLTEEEEAWVQAERDGLTKLAGAIGFTLPQNDDERLALCDEIIRWWHCEPRDQRIDAHRVVNPIGVAMGDVLAREFGLAWKIVTDAFGTDLGLWRAKGQIVLSPVHSVAKRFADESNGFVVSLCGAMRAQLRSMGDW